MDNIVLYTNTKRDTGLEVTRQVGTILEKMGVRYSVCTRSDALDDALAGTDAVITLGGDGTILHAARSAAKYSIPLLGINLGHKGFIAELEVSDIDYIERLRDGAYGIEQRMMLDVSVVRSGEVIHTDYALNDAVIGGMARVVSISVFGDDNKISAFQGDGIVIATPTGSTAYSLAAGGPIVEPEAENIIVTPICPHVLWAKSYVLASDRKVTVELGELSDKVAYLSMDGEDPFALEGGDRIRVSKSSLATRLIKLTDRSFYEKVSKKLGEK